MSKNKIFKATFIVMAMTILSRIIGFGRDMLAAYHFGVGEAYDIYVAIHESVFLRKEIVSVFYERGKFDSEAVMLTAMALLGYSIQGPFVGIRLSMIKGKVRREV
ncbi:hypothetical protein ACH36K_12575 [Clostridium sp. MB05]|uniref:hypothetical protein n=1 Tax=Clostridium sp. MB05 TaxID=3376682 RepID=UPI003982D341